LFWLVPETRGKEPEDLWPAEAVPVVMPDEASDGRAAGGSPGV
jgi:hypothetical protein